MKSLPLLALLAVSACTVGPDYEQPTIALNAGFAEGGTTPAADLARQRWWRGYGDTVLNGLVERGLDRNLDIQSAVAAVRAAEAAARAAGVASDVTGTLSAGATRSGGDGIATSDSRTAGFSPSLVIDLFGGSRRSREAAVANLDAAALGVGEARLAFLSALVGYYIDARYYQEAMAVTRQSIGLTQETLGLVRDKRDLGTATDLDVARAEATLSTARASLPTLEANFYGATYAIATLLAEPVQTFKTALEKGAAQPLPTGKTSVGVPADLLRNRPDVRAAERRYAAAVAAVGVSEAEMYPALSLGGTISATDGNGSWSFGPALTLPVLSQPLLAANRDKARAEAEQSRIAWKASVLDAVEEVQTAQSTYLRTQRSLAAQRASVTSYQRVLSLSQETFDLGTTDAMDLLDTQQSLLTARLSAASARRDLASGWASLQVAAGAGWQ